MVSADSSRLSLEFSQQTYLAAYARFTPSKSGQRLPPTYYRGCWHVVSRGFFLGYRPFRPREKGFTSRRTSSPTRRRCVRLSPIAQYPSLRPPGAVGAVSHAPSG